MHIDSTYNNSTAMCVYSKETLKRVHQDIYAKMLKAALFVIGKKQKQEENKSKCLWTVERINKEYCIAGKRINRNFSYSLWHG